ncbi:MAG: hypothetical protein JXR03_09285 [Cyclobacteriaceae bacterium]
MILILITVIACTNGGEKAGLVNWVEDPANGLRSISQIENFQYDLQYQPNIYRSLGQYDEVNAELLDSLNSVKSELEYFMLRITSLDQSKNVFEILKEYKISKEDLIYHFSYKMQNVISLVRAGDTLAPVLYHYERSYGVRKEETFLMAFDLGKKKEVDSEMLLEINSRFLSRKKIVLDKVSSFVALDDIL